MRACRKLAALVAVLVWLGALVYLLELSRRKLPEPGGAAGGEAADSQPVFKLLWYFSCSCFFVFSPLLTLLLSGTSLEFQLLQENVRRNSTAEEDTESDQSLIIWLSGYEIISLMMQQKCQLPIQTHEYSIRSSADPAQPPASSQLTTLWGQRSGARILWRSSAEPDHRVRGQELASCGGPQLGLTTGSEVTAELASCGGPLLSLTTGSEVRSSHPVEVLC
ncbi:hypothetical protein FQA47_003913 [Oryzias melastigma]|uniref:Uncharacterized protein n=1 Tax=Oryzias melastigma TaxID=30732 RepID=A0A834C9X3_ORYME|nr:hypothetical protein FQA47_003913 [Oryzias melastigma]